MLVETRTIRPDKPLPVELDSPQTLLLLFADPTLLENDYWVKQITAVFPQSILVGCSTITPFANGQIETGRGVLTICRFEKSELQMVVQPIASPEESQHAGQAVGQALYRPDLRLLLLLGDDRAMNGNDFMTGLNSVAPKPVLISGGMASHPDFAVGKRTLIADNQLYSRAAVAVGLYGDALSVHQSEDVGLTTRSRMYKVTGTGDRLITEIDGRPALDVYKEFMGTLAGTMDFMHVFPVGFYETSDSPMKVVRSVLGVDQEAKALIFASDLPPQTYIRFMVGLPNQFVESAGHVAETVGTEMLAGHDPHSLLALMVSCASRKFVLSENVAKEPLAAYAPLASQATQAGFYAYGEIAWSPAGYCELHNHTINITLVGEN